MKRKKFWIVFGSCCLSVVLLCTIFAFVFRLKTVDIEIRSREEQTKTNLGEDIRQTVLDSGEFDFGKNIVFMNFEDNIEKIEKSNPYVKVEQVVRRFPNIVRVYISERVPRYRVKDASSENWYILDVDFKVLDKVSASELKSKVVCGNSNYFDRTIEITKETLTFESAIIGEFVEDDIMIYLTDITTGVYGKTKDITAVRKIDYSGIDKTFTLTMRNAGNNDQLGCNIVISGTSKLYEKVLKGITTFITCSDPVIKDENGQDIEIGEALIKNIPDEIIEVKQDSNGKIYVIKPSGETE